MAPGSPLWPGFNAPVPMPDGARRKGKGGSCQRWRRWELAVRKGKEDEEVLAGMSCGGGERGGELRWWREGKEQLQC